MSGLSDSFQRPINYLRISVTDRCNLRCKYCMPANVIPLLPRCDILSFEEIYTIVHAAAELGIAKVRISGGEPLMRAGLPELIRLISQIDGVDDISLTTNGTVLEQCVWDLKKAGLHRINISLDTLNRDRYREITGFDRLDDVLRGIQSAQTASLQPVKINVVVTSLNENEVVEFALRSKELGWHVRFIELMPFVDSAMNPVSAESIRQQLASLGPLDPCLPPTGNGPAKYYRIADGKGTIGFITPISEHFCFRCNRLRLTADGQLLPCLLSNEGVDMRQLLRSGSPVQELKALISKVANSKPEGHRLEEGCISMRQMTQLGG